MKSRTTVILLIVVAIVGAFVAYDFRKNKTTGEIVGLGKRIVPFKAADITQIDLVHSNLTIVLRKANDQWNVTKPLVARADSAAVQAILDELELADCKRRMTGADLRGVNLADFGLATPRTKGVFHGKDGTTTVIVGNETPTKDALYLQVEDQTDVFVADRSIYDRLSSTLDMLRSRIVMDVSAPLVTRVELKSKDRVIELAKAAAPTNTTAQWTITKPITARADVSKVSDLLNELAGLRVQDFVSEDPKDVHAHQLDEPQHEVTVFTGESGKTLLVGGSPTNDDSKAYAKLKSGDSIYTVSADSAKKLSPQINDLRDPHVLSFARDEVHGIEVTRGADKLALARDDQGWKITAPVSVAADDEAVGRLLDQLADLSATEFVADVATDLDKYGLAVPTLTVTLLGQGTNVVSQLLVGGADPRDGMRFVKSASEPFIYGMAGTATAKLPLTVLALRTRQLADLRADDIQKVELHGETGRVVLERDAGKKWKLVQPSQGALDTDALQRMLAVLSTLHAAELVKDGTSGLSEYGLDQPSYRVTVQTANRTLSVALGKSRDQQTRYALTSDPALVVTVPVAVANTLSRNILVVPAATTTNAPPPAAKPAP